MQRYTYCGPFLPYAKPVEIAAKRKNMGLQLVNLVSGVSDPSRTDTVESARVDSVGVTAG